MIAVLYVSNMATTGSPENPFYRKVDPSGNRRRWRIVGLSGISGGGKSTLAYSLLAALPTTVVYLGQDEYILPDEHPSHPKAAEEIGCVNKETIRSIDMRKMLADIKKILSSDPNTIAITDYSTLLERKKMIGCGLPEPRQAPYGCRQHSSFPAVLLLDGFLLYMNSEVSALCDLRYFFTLTKAECWSRRSKRKFTNSLSMSSRQYFDSCVWPSYTEHFSRMSSSVTDVHLLEGTSSPTVMHERVLKDIFNVLEYRE
ncbi:hypothetical protein Pmani_023951 [Petrolisthes manimaculis]|uniref:Nicotinamide riboside kinase 1 n=1 Tax=Petrolisthes manimaculis TaxID=1843537 RepID=A0AAE1P8T5_9EUCA|nr:hypothetical protein Pmani_023951 [Petrolisthes manimaculis]